MEKYRDEDGYLNINDIVMGKRYISCYDGFYFEYNGETYFYRINNPLFIYNEMVGYELAKDFGIPAVDYDIARYWNSVGNISKNFFTPTMVYLEDVLVNFYGSDRNKCNLNDVLFALEESFSTKVKNKVEKQLIDMLMFDLIIANPDRHDKNIVFEMKNDSLGPIFDNELMLSRTVYNDKFCFGVFPGERNTLDDFLNYMDEDTIKIFIDKIMIISKENIESVLERIEKRIGTKMDSVAKNLLMKKFEVQYAYLNEKIKEYNNRRRLILDNR